MERVRVAFKVDLIHHPLELDSKEYVCDLGPGIGEGRDIGILHVQVIKVDGNVEVVRVLELSVGMGTDVDYPGLMRSIDERPQFMSQVEMSEVVYPPYASRIPDWLEFAWAA